MLWFQHPSISDLGHYVPCLLVHSCIPANADKTGVTFATARYALRLLLEAPLPRCGLEQGPPWLVDYHKDVEIVERGHQSYMAQV